MTIGEALRYEQKIKGYTNKQMAAGIVSQATYSKVISNQQKLASDLLIKLLFYHDIDIESFFEKLKSTYMPKKKVEEKHVVSRIVDAFNTHNVIQAERYLKKLEALNINSGRLLQSEIAVAYLKEDINNMDSKLIDKILYEVNQSSNWIRNIRSLSLFTTAIIVLPSEKVEVEMRLFFTKLERLDNINEKLIERYAILCDNYLHWRYDHKKEKGENVIRSLEYLKSLPDIPQLAIYRISGLYYEALFDKNIRKASKIRNQLLELDCKTGVKNWPV